MQELHQRYYEPLARIAPSLEDIVQGPPVKKLLFMTDPTIIDDNVKPLWEVSYLDHLPLSLCMSTLELSLAESATDTCFGQKQPNAMLSSSGQCEALSYGITGSP